MPKSNIQSMTQHPTTFHGSANFTEGCQVKWPNSMLTLQKIFIQLLAIDCGHSKHMTQLLLQSKLDKDEN